MAFHTRADHIAQQNGKYEPQRMHNFKVEIPVESVFAAGVSTYKQEMVSLSLVQCTLPVHTNDVIPIPYGNEEIYLAGKSKWEAGQMICRDYIDMPVLEALLEWRRSVFDQRTGALGTPAIYKRDMKIVLFGPDGSDEYERVWTLVGAWPVRVNPSAQGMDMNNPGVVMIECMFRFDKAWPEFVWSGGL